MLSAGWSVFGATYLTSALIGAIAYDTATDDPLGADDNEDQKDFGLRMLIPLGGPFAAIPAANSATGGLFAALLGAGQIAGVILGTVGAVRVSRSRRQVMMTLVPTPTGSALALTGRF